MYEYMANVCFFNAVYGYDNEESWDEQFMRKQKGCVIVQVSGNQ